MKVSKSGYREYIRRRKLNAQIGRESLEGLVRDVFSRKAAGRSMPDRITEEPAIDAIEQAVGREGPPSDRSLALHDDSKNVASRFCGNRNGTASCSRDRIAAS